MIHASYYKPKIIPVLVDALPANLDRVQELTKTATLNRTKIEEVGRDGLVDWRKATPAISLTLRQLEFGSIATYRQMANKGASVNTINYTDFKTSKFDIIGYKTDDNGTFLGTIYYPGLRLSACSLTIGDPEALLERNYTCVGEDEYILLNNNKYLIHGRYIIAGTGQNQTVSISTPTPASDPDNSGQYLFRVVKVSGGTATELLHGTGWSYNGAGTLTINGSSTAGDVILVVYSAATDPNSQANFTLNDTDLAGITADSVSIYLAQSNYLYRLQSVGLDTTFDRTDYREVGSQDVVARGVRDITHRITLGRMLEAYTIEEVLRGVAGQSYGKIDVREFTDNLSLIIKIFSDSTKTTFKMGYKITDLAPVGVDAGVPVSEYITQGVTLEGESGFITTVQGVL
jgi:hypothetical protein